MTILETKYGIKDIDKKYNHLVQSYIDNILSEEEKESLSAVDAYFTKRTSEEEIKLAIMEEVAEYMEENLEKSIEQVEEIRNVQLTQRFRRNVLSFIDIIKSDKFKEAVCSYAKTTDNMRVDVGLIMSRPPIFLG